MKTKIGLLAVLMSVLFISCNNDNSNQSSTPMTADDLSTSAKLDDMSNDLSAIAENQFAQQAATTGKSTGTVESNLPACATVTTVVTSTTWTRTIDFGTEGCAMPNGNILKGKIIISGSKNFDIPTYSLSYTLENFYHNDILIQGSKTIIRTKATSANLAAIHPIHTMNIDFTATDSLNVVRSINGSRIIEKVQGFDTPQFSDDAILISGNETITNPKGTISATITTPLSILANCKYIVSGVVAYTKNNKTATLDYGKGDCDKYATVTIDGKTETIKLKK